MMWVVLQLLVWTVNFSSLATRVYFELQNADCIQKVYHIDIDLLSAKSIETSSKVITMEELHDSLSAVLFTLLQGFPLESEKCDNTGHWRVSLSDGLCQLK